MVALCFANGLQGGLSQTFAQSTEALKHTFHINDAALGVVPFCVGIAGNVGGVPVAHFCARHSRTAVLAGMFALWGALVTLAALTPSFTLLGFGAAGFVIFGVFRVASSTLEATDPAALPLIGDWWSMDDRAKKISIFNAGAAVGTFGGLIIAGVVVDDFGWRWAFVMWLPLALIGSYLIATRPEPARGGQDAHFSQELVELEAAEGIEPGAPEGREQLQEGDTPGVAAAEPVGDRWDIVRQIARLRSWRLAAVGFAVTGIFGNGIGVWGLAFFKRTFGLDGAQAAALAPVLGVGAFAGVLGGGFLADRLLARGMLRARIYVTAFGYVSGATAMAIGLTMPSLWLATPLLALGAGLAALPTGPQYALLMDVTPSPLRSQASAATNVLQAVGSIGSLLVGVLSTLFGENLRLALLCVSPFYVVGGLLVLAAGRTYVADLELVVAEAKERLAGADPVEPDSA